MRRRLLVSSVSVASVLGLLGVVAGGSLYAIGCGSGDDTTTTTPNDAGHGPDATTSMTPDAGDDDTDLDAFVPPTDANGGQDAMVTIDLDASAAAATVYAGQSATVDASAMATGTTVSFAWSIMSAPAGSAITTASIQNAASSTATVPTDRVGTYVVLVTATGGGATATATVTITATTANVVFAEAVALSDGGILGSGWTINSDGTGAHAFTCAIPIGAPPSGQGSANESVGEAARSGSDTFEGAPGTPTRVVFSASPTVDGGRYYAPFYATDTAATCADAGTDAGLGARLLYVGTFGTSAVAGGFHPRFSPDGTKVLLNVSSETGSTKDVLSKVAVVSFDGTTVTPISTLGDPATATTGETADVGLRRQAEWIDNGHIGWIRAEKLDAGPATWNVVTASVPIVSGEPKVVMSCTGPAPNRVVFLADGSFIGSVQTSASSPADLLHITADTNNHCVVAHNYTAIDGGGGSSNARAFAVSPDGKSVAYSVHNDAVFQNDEGVGIVYVAAIDGMTPPVAIDGAMLDSAGIRWVAGGSELAFTHVAADGSGQPTGYASVAVAPAFADGGSVTDLVTGDAAVAVTAVGDGEGVGCNAAGSSGSRSSAPFASTLVSLLGLAFVRRRRARA